MKDKVEIARRYRKRKHYKKSIQETIPFPAPETMKQDLANHLRATGQMMYDSYLDCYWCAYHGIKIVEDHLHHVCAYYVGNVNEKYSDATEEQLYAAIKH